MVETMKVNLNKTYLFLKITGIVAGVLIAAAVVYGELDNRMDEIEKSQVEFKGVMGERTRNMSDKMDMIYDIVKELNHKEE